MQRILAEADRSEVVALLRRDPEHNLYLLGNLDALGFDTNFCVFHGFFGAHGALQAVANRYFVNWGVFGTPDADWQEVADFLDAQPNAERLQDNPGGIRSILPLLKRLEVDTVQVEELMRLAPLDFAPQPAPDDVMIRRATFNDADELAALYAYAGSMARSRAGIERPLRDATFLVAERDGAIVSSALTNAETSDLAMIGGVWTPPEHRGQGLARATVSALCQHLLNAGKTPVLYWDNPAAGKVYRTLGFRQIGTWRAVRFAPSRET